MGVGSENLPTSPTRGRGGGGGSKTTKLKEKYKA